MYRVGAANTLDFGKAKIGSRHIQASDNGFQKADPKLRGNTPINSQNRININGIKQGKKRPNHSSDHLNFLIIFSFFRSASEKTRENGRKREFLGGIQKNLKNMG